MKRLTNILLIISGLLVTAACLCFINIQELVPNAIYGAFSTVEVGVILMMCGIYVRKDTKKKSNTIMGIGAFMMYVGIISILTIKINIYEIVPIVMIIISATFTGLTLAFNVAARKDNKKEVE